MSGLGNKEIMARNIKFYMDKARKDRKQVCDDLGFKYTTFTDWVNGNKYPRIDKIELMANYFGIQKSDLIEEHKEVSDRIDYSSMIQVPIVGSISCGNGNVAYRDIEGYEPTPEEWVRGGNYFYHRAQGDSMINARIMDGDLVLIREQSDVENGEIAAVLIDDDTYLKRVFKDNGTLVLQSENPNYAPIICSNKTNGYIKIIGKLKKIIISA